MNETTPYPKTFLAALKFTLASEGGYVNDANDRGGETNHGISAAQYPDLDIKSLSQNDTIQIYYQDYWQANRCNEWPAPLACALFDTAVLMGADDAIPYMQQALGVSADGLIGPQTLRAANACIEQTTVEAFLSYRAKHHVNDCINNRNQYKYIRGWLLRTYRLQTYLYDAGLL